MALKTPAIQDTCSNFGKPGTTNPLKDIPADQEPGRTYRIVPADNGATNDIDVLFNGTTKSAAGFLQVAKDADMLYDGLDGTGKVFFNDNLQAPTYYMHYLNESLLELAKAYKSNDKATKINGVKKALHEAEKALKETQHGNFGNWYAGDKVFGFEGLYKTFDGILEKC